MKSNLFKMPKAVTINGRSSSLTNAFVNGIIPCIEPTHEEIEYALEILGQNDGNIVCVYCGDRATEWDHLNPLILKQKPTGYISEIKNLVPACGKCNQSKGNKYWKEWIRSKAVLSPFQRNVANLEEKIRTIERYQEIFIPVIIDFEKIVDHDLWSEHWMNHKSLLEILKNMQVLSNKIKEQIRKNIM